MLTATRPETFRNLQLDAGIFVANFKYSEFKTADEMIAALKQMVANNVVLNGQEIPEGGALVGATIGGGGFNATPTVRAIDSDGKRYEFIGSEVVEKWDIRLTGTLKEVTPGTMKMALAMADVATDGDVSVVTLRTDIKKEDYIKELVWVGDTTMGAMLIAIKNALNTTGVSMTFQDKNEGNIPFTFVAHQENVQDYSLAPVKIMFLRNSAAAAASAEPDGGQGEPAAYDPETASAEA